MAANHKLHSTQQEVILQQLIEKNNAIGNTTKKCPVCKNVSSIESTYCDNCGFQFPPLYTIDGNDSYTFDDKSLSISKANHDSLLMLSDENERLRNVLVEKEVSLYETSKKCSDYQKSIEKIETLLASKEKEIEEFKTTSSQASEYYLSQTIQLEEEKKGLHKRLINAEGKLEELKGQLKQQEADLVTYCNKANSLSYELNDTKKQIDGLKKEIDKQKKESQSRIEKLQQENTKLTKQSEQSEQEQKRIEQAYMEAQKKIKELETKLSSVDSQQFVESDLYDVILVSYGKQKLAVTKLVKETLNIGLKETVELVDKVPDAVIQNGLIYSKALLLKSELEDMGAIAELHPANSQSRRIDNSANLNRPKITSSDDVMSIINSCKKLDYSFYNLFSSDSVTDKLDLGELVKLLATYGIKASIDEVKYYKTIGKLKSMILNKAGLPPV